jgi:succinate dehydrogenase/fumarate reductase-like Fe-S protein
VTPEDKEGLIAKLQEVEDWLYEDGEDETKGVYIAKLEELKKVCLKYTACIKCNLLIQSFFPILKVLDDGSFFFSFFQL